MTQPEIQPAMTAEEWKSQRIDFPELAATGGKGRPITIRFNSVGLLVSRDCVVPPSKQPALAALCLYQQPFGFSRADIDLLTRLCISARDLSRDEFVAADHLAARIAALLPPSTDSTP